MTKLFSKVKYLLNRDSLERALFYSIVFLLPINLGYHFIFKEAYVRGLLIDYLIPTIYLQDILIFLLLLLNRKAIKLGANSEDKYLIWFIFTVFLSTLVSEIMLASIGGFLRLLLYVGFYFYVKEHVHIKKDMYPLAKTMCFSVILLALLALAQWVNQGAVFNNYLIFGEQPYNLGTAGINREYLFGSVTVPPYGTFRHPNILGGFLGVVLIFILPMWRKNVWFKLAGILGITVLFVSFSKFAWVGFIVSALIVAFWFKKNIPEKILQIIIFIAFLALFLAFIPNIFNLHYNPSFYRRVDLLTSSYKVILKNPIFGVGYNNSTAFIDKHLPIASEVRFPQPTHNIFVLLSTESGIVSLCLFLIFYWLKLVKARKHPVVYAVLVQMLFLGSFDHYILTMHQSQLLFWLIMGLI